MTEAHSFVISSIKATKSRCLAAAANARSNTSMVEMQDSKSDRLAQSDVGIQPPLTRSAQRP